MANVTNLKGLFLGWAFFYQIVLIVHFAIRKPLFESYTLRYGWIVYALCIPAAAISVYLLVKGEAWYFWLGGFLCVLFSGFGFWVDYVARIPWRNPLNPSILFPYIILYLSTIMFYWWPVGRISRPLWFVYGVLFVVATILNVTSH